MDYWIFFLIKDFHDLIKFFNLIKVSIYNHLSSNKKLLQCLKYLLRMKTRNKWKSGITIFHMPYKKLLHMHHSSDTWVRLQPRYSLLFK
uniref:Uncharacterized protein n=1 Tax=Heterorhabditis bacteriophora TaxID=37862 RepID=A0A1I7WAJ1_HETBA